MSVIDILFRVDNICLKYDKYDIDKQRDLNAYGDDNFARLYADVESSIEAALNVLFSFPYFPLFSFVAFVLVFLNSRFISLQKSELALSEKNRAAAAAMNAEVRRTKGRLMDEIPKLRKLAHKKVKHVSQAIHQL